MPIILRVHRSILLSERKPMCLKTELSCSHRGRGVLGHSVGSMTCSTLLLKLCRAMKSKSHCRWMEFSVCDSILSVQGIQLAKYAYTWGDSSGLQSMHKERFLHFMLIQLFVRTPRQNTETCLQASFFFLATVIMVGVCASFLFLKEPLTHFLKVWRQNFLFCWVL